MTASLLFMQFHDEVFVVGQREFRECEDHVFAMSAVDYLYVIVCPHRPYDLLLNGRTFGDFLVDDLERKVIHVERHVGRVL